MSSSLSVYSYCFYRNRGLIGTETIGTPPGYTIVIRDIEVWIPNNAGDNAVAFQIRDTGTQAIMWNVPSKANSLEWVQWTGHIVIGQGSGIDIVSDFFPCDVTVSGYLLTGSAPIQIVGSPAP